LIATTRQRRADQAGLGPGGSVAGQFKVPESTDLSNDELEDRFAGDPSP